MVCQPMHMYIYPHLLCSIFIGIVIVLFFKCMNALLNPVDRTRRAIRWLLVVHTVAMFSFATVFTGMYLVLQSICYIDTREFPGNSNSPSGPIAHQHQIYSDPISLIPRIMFFLNNWLADGLLVRSVFSAVAWAFNAGNFPSSIAAMLSSL